MKHGDLIENDRTPAELIINRALVAEVIFTNKTPLNSYVVYRNTNYVLIEISL